MVQNIKMCTLLLAEKFIQNRQMVAQLPKSKFVRSCHFKYLGIFSNIHFQNSHMIFRNPLNKQKNCVIIMPELNHLWDKIIFYDVPESTWVTYWYRKKNVYGIINQFHTNHRKYIFKAFNFIFLNRSLKLISSSIICRSVYPFHKSNSYEILHYIIICKYFENLVVYLCNF